MVADRASELNSECNEYSFREVPDEIRPGATTSLVDVIGKIGCGLMNRRPWSSDSQLDVRAVTARIMGSCGRRTPDFAGIAGEDG